MCIAPSLPTAGNALFDRRRQCWNLQCQNWVTLRSVGILQSPRGESATEPTFGPSGRQERLNCWRTNLRINTLSQRSIVASS